MDYFLSFLEGILTFISPCFLPMIPIYIAYFAADGSVGVRTGKYLANVAGFIAGFTATFISLGAFAAAFGTLLVRHQNALHIITGTIVILFGLHYLGAFPFLIKLFRSSNKEITVTGFFSAFVFGLIFSISWTPCVGAFLGSALMLASQSGSAIKGIAMLLCFSAGLAIPFLISALLLDKLNGAFSFIKRHYSIITKLSGLFLIAVGIFMATGTLGRLLARLSF